MLEQCGYSHRKEFSKLVPESHKKFFRECDWVIEHPYYLSLHAVFDHSKSLQSQIDVLKKKFKLI